VAREKRRAFQEWTYWGKPVPGFGDVHAQLLILALRQRRTAATGRDASLQGIAPAIFSLRRAAQSGVCDQPTSLRRGRRFAAYERLHHRDNPLCAAGKQTAARRNSELPGLLQRELEILAEGGFGTSEIAWTVISILLKQRELFLARGLRLWRMEQKRNCRLPFPRLFGVYHPSQQNTQTGRVTAGDVCAGASPDWAISRTAARLAQLVRAGDAVDLICPRSLRARKNLGLSIPQERPPRGSLASSEGFVRRSKYIQPKRKFAKISTHTPERLSQMGEDRRRQCAAVEPESGKDRVLIVRRRRERADGLRGASREMRYQCFGSGKRQKRPWRNLQTFSHTP